MHIVSALVNATPVLRYAKSRITTYDTHPISAAIRSGDYNIVKLMLDKEHQDYSLDYFCLMGAVDNKVLSDSETVVLLKLLVSKGAIYDKDDRLIGAAVLKNKTLTVLYLISIGAPMNKDEVLFTYTLSNYDPVMLDALLKYGANVNARNSDGLTALEDRMSMTTPPPKILIEQLKAAGVPVSIGIVNTKKSEYFKYNKQQCEDINSQWWHAFANALRGEPLTHEEDISIPAYCKKYL
jgi:ankyrin repeat protein